MELACILLNLAEESNTSDIIGESNMRAKENGGSQ